MMTVEEYDAEEAKFCRELPNRLIAAAQPMVFNQIGYPHRAQSTEELWKWADAMHECRFEQDFKKLLGGSLNEDEWSRWQHIMRAVHGLTSRWGHPVVPHGALARATFVARCIRAIADPPAGVMDFGAGSGYLSAMLPDYQMTAVDNSQAFYLWQEQLFTALNLFVNHVPWWDYYDPWYEYKESKFCVSVVTINHCINEMTDDAFVYLKAHCEILKQHNDAMIVIEGPGLDITGKLNRTEQFAQSAILMEWHDFDHVVICAPQNAVDRYRRWEHKPEADYEEVCAFMKDLAGGDWRTPDEQWLNLIHGSHYYS